MTGIGNYLKRHTEALVKDVGIENACDVNGKSKATLGQYYSDNEEHSDRFMPIDIVALLEKTSSFPHVTVALSELCGATVSLDESRRDKKPSTGGVNADVVALSQRFAMLMSEYHQSIQDGIITVNESKRLLKETVALQQVLIDMKLHLESDTV